MLVAKGEPVGKSIPTFSSLSDPSHSSSASCFTSGLEESTHLHRDRAQTTTARPPEDPWRRSGVSHQKENQNPPNYSLDCPADKGNRGKFYFPLIRFRKPTANATAATRSRCSQLAVLRFWFTGEDCGKAGRLREQTPVNARPSVGRSQTAGLSAGPIRSGDLLAH